MGDTLPPQEGACLGRSVTSWDERLRFVARLLEGEKMAPLCAEFDLAQALCEAARDGGQVGYDAGRAEAQLMERGLLGRRIRELEAGSRAGKPGADDLAPIIQRLRCQMETLS